MCFAALPARCSHPQQKEGGKLFKFPLPFAGSLQRMSAGKFSTGGADHACEDHTCLHGVQAQKLCFQEEQEE
jgi:hypothetical protein